MRAQRIDAPAPGFFSFTLFAHGQRHVLLLWIKANHSGVGVALVRPQGDPANSFVQRLRTKVENAKLSEAHWLLPLPTSETALGLELVFSRGETRERLLVDFDAQHPNLLLLDAQDRYVGAADERALRQRFPARRGPFVLGRGRGVSMPGDLASATQLAERLTEHRDDTALDRERRDLRQRGQSALKRAERKATAIQGDLSRIAVVPQLRREANLLLRHMHAIPRGSHEIVLEDDSLEPPEVVTIALDPSHDANRNAQSRFERARKLERGTDIAKIRLMEAAALVDQLRAWLIELASADAEQLEALRQRAQHLGLQGLTSTKERKRGPQTRVPYRTFVAKNGQIILVGKGAVDNDTLTLTVARPHDHWLHVRGTHGAHVVVPCERKTPISAELLVDAAHLAAHFSAVRGEPSAEVQHTERRYIRKPKGSAPGSVIVDREKVLLVRIESDRLQALLSSERASRS